MNALSRTLLAAGALALAIQGANAQPADQQAAGFDGYDEARECGTKGGFSRHLLQIVGLTSDGRLVCFDEWRPHKARTIGTVGGLSGGDTSLVGIDYRVQDRRLYGVGNAGGVYVIDAKTAATTLVNRLTVPLTGTRFGVDFNPAADRLRIVSDTGQNLRHNVNAGGVTIADATLNYTAGVPAPGVTGSAYTNNDTSPDTATTLYALDAALDQIAIQSPPNNGSLAATGKLGIDTGDMTGFDIYSIVRNNTTLDVVAFASLSAADGRTALYEVTLATGRALARGAFSTQNQVVDIAIPLNQL